MTHSRVAQGIVSAFCRRSSGREAATSTSCCYSSGSISSNCRSSGRASLERRCTSTVSTAMPSSTSSSSSRLDRVPWRPVFSSFASMSTLSTYYSASRKKMTTLRTEKSICATSDRGFFSSSSSPSTSSSTSSTGAEEETADHHLDEASFHAAADDTLHDLVDALESWVDCEVEGDEADVEYSSGVLTLRLGEGKGTYVINKQAPNRQLWLSSPVGGPVRYDLVPSSSSSAPASSSGSVSSPSRWIYHRDGHEMRDRLREELAGLFGKAPKGL